MGIDNTCSVSGNVGSDPELRYTGSGLAVASFSIAVYEGKDKPPSWYDVTCWDKLAENVTESITQGARITVVGRLTQDKWETDAGEKRSKVKIIADDVSASLKWATVSISRTERDDESGGDKKAPQKRKAAPAKQQFADEEPF